PGSRNSFSRRLDAFPRKRRERYSLATVPADERFRVQFLEAVDDDVGVRLQFLMGAGIVAVVDADSAVAGVAQGAQGVGRILETPGRIQRRVHEAPRMVVHLRLALRGSHVV